MTEVVVLRDINWADCPAVERIVGKVSGQWLVKGTRILADGVVENADAGYSAEEISGDLYEGLSLDLTKSILDHVRRQRAQARSI